MPSFAARLAKMLVEGAGPQAFVKDAEDSPFLFECFRDCIGREIDIPKARLTNPRAIAFRRDFEFFRLTIRPPEKQTQCPFSR